MEELRALHGITDLLAIAGIPRASYYKWRATQSQRDARKDKDHEIKEHMMAIHFAHPDFGYPRMTTALWEAGYNVNHKKVWRVMRELSIQSVIRKKRKKSSYTPSVVYPNRLKRQFHATAPQQKNGDRYYLYFRRDQLSLLVRHSRSIQQRDCRLAIVGS